MAKIFITRPIPQVGIDMLRDAGHEVTVNEAAEDRAATKEEVLAGVRGMDAILSILTEKIDSEVMDAGLPTLKVIANYAVGYDNIDVKTATSKNILVTNTPGVLTETVAEHTFTLMLSIAHRVPEADRFTRAGKYKAWGPKLLLGTDMSGKTLGVVGLGRIGSRVAHHAVKGFGMKVLYNDQKQNSDFEKEYEAQFFAKIEDMLPRCDFISVHVPLLDATKHLINAERLGMMKNTAYLVNTSRGPIVDEKALAKALADKQIKGAALDVFEFEPEIVPELKDLDNVIITPHIASGTEETRDKMASMAATNIIEALKGNTPPNLVK